MERAQRVLAVDVGGTKVDAMVFAGDPGTPRPTLLPETRQTFETPDQPPAQALGEFQAWLRDVASQWEVDGWAMAVAGPLAEDHRQILTSPNIPFISHARPEEWDLGLLANRPFALANDLEAAAAGEVRWGRYGIADEYVILDTISTGWGGAFINRGEVWPGEPGHNPYVPVDGLPCGCGRFGCYEAYFSGSAAARRVREHFLARGAPVPEDEDPNRRLADAAQAGELWALALLHEFGAGIGLGWAESLNRLSRLHRILYMGGFAVAMMPFMEPAIRASIRARSRFPRHWTAEGLPIQPATYTQAEPFNPTLIGAAAVWMDRFGNP
ncbi:MAG: ROK family protein [Armatimonadetes bacterium]|nr:ROK family protein [Armatimonadota bacterium]